MALSSLFDLITRKMAYDTQRQGVIAENVANANTPAYKPKDLVSFDQALEQAGGPHLGGALQMAVTDARHLSGTQAASGSFKTVAEKDLYEVKPSGNAVVLEQQMTQLAQTYSDYSMVTGLYHKAIGLIKTALSHQSS